MNQEVNTQEMILIKPIGMIAMTFHPGGIITFHLHPEGIITFHLHLEGIISIQEITKIGMMTMTENMWIRDILEEETTEKVQDKAEDPEKEESLHPTGMKSPENTVM